MSQDVVLTVVVSASQDPPLGPSSPDRRGQTYTFYPSKDPRTSLDLKEGTLTVADATTSPLESVLLVLLSVTKLPKNMSLAYGHPARDYISQLPCS